ncbi:MAG: TetR/AcrR family transcriptional regulator [Phenylobacterium sp.]|uniref:TetR/AcrR family transcriptional regulator n=1 Tax=Phenylobacterium sp. TaxID=1871053 RepID=UPI0027339419|nr:TetR/AcrR family transcriptional regulator [Phenylobacterium sp.]MDP3747381.1 TetR/AcrR family transcriptional regulator [Phenylobacterium sp.]
MSRTPDPPQRRQRLSPEVRRARMVEAAALQALEQGSLPISPEAIARQVGVSKALVYSYFPTQHDLLNALLLYCLRDLEQDGLEAALAGPCLETVAVDTALIYFEHVARRGALLHLLMSDLYMAGHLNPEVVRIRDGAYLRLGRLVRRELRLEPKANLLAINLVMTIPEEAGRRVFSGDMDREAGRALCRQLTASAVRGLKPGG